MNSHTTPTRFSSIEIRRANDSFRMSGAFFGGKNRWVCTPSVLARADLLEVFNRVMSFNDFTESNNPYGECDMGIFQMGSDKIMWKIDYYDLQYKYGVDPYETSVCEMRRVMTIMHASEY